LSTNLRLDLRKAATELPVLLAQTVCQLTDLAPIRLKGGIMAIEAINAALQSIGLVDPPEELEIFSKDILFLSKFVGQLTAIEDASLITKRVSRGFDTFQASMIDL